MSGYQHATNLHYDLLILPPGDADFNGRVDLSDLGILATNWGRTIATGPEEGDFTEDHHVDLSDLGILAAWWGAGAQATGTAKSPSIELQPGEAAGRPDAADHLIWGSRQGIADLPTAAGLAGRPRRLVSMVLPASGREHLNGVRRRLSGEVLLRMPGALTGPIRHVPDLEVLDALSLWPIGQGIGEV